ncbi:MAG: hypothetical protein RIC16_15130 [Rhodospirillales bacterium]
MTVNPGNILKIAWIMPPRDFWRRTRLKLKRTFAAGSVTVRDRFDADPDARDWRRHFATLSRIETAASHRLPGWAPFAPEGRTVLEIGCGMTGGTGPLMLFRGAAKAYGIEPNWDASVLTDAHFVETYYRPLWQHLSAIYGERLAFDAFMARLRADLVISADTDVARLADAIAPGTLDFCLSISCLEHVAGLDGTIRGLAALGGPGTRHVHLVDFGNHWSKDAPFAGLYDTERSRAVKANAPGINALRLPDVLKTFADHGLAARPLVFERRALDPAAVHPSWQDAYALDDLGVRVAVVFV